MTTFVLAPKEDWICDRFVKEWYAHNPGMTTHDPRSANVVWLLADWAWNHIPYDVLKSKRIVTSVHHIVPEKFDARAIDEFRSRDSITDLYHAPCQKTADQIAPYTTKPIWVRPFWVNDGIFKPRNKQESRRRVGLPEDMYLVGSFQRDTEGKDLKSPKLEKGPDLLADHLIRVHQDRVDATSGRGRGWIPGSPISRAYTTNEVKVDSTACWIQRLHVVLAGWRRQYIIGRLEERGVPHTYFDRPPQETLLDLYASLDMYVVSARYEGGPQSIVECAAMEVPIVSTDVGLATRILAPESVGSNLLELRPNVVHARNSVQDLFISNGGMDPFREMLENIG